MIQLRELLETSINDTRGVILDGHMDTAERMRTEQDLLT
jgi:hypothetical protein